MFFIGCGEDSFSSQDRYTPTLDTTWQWQLSGELNTAYDVTLYDIDLFDSSTTTIASLKASGKRVICYFSAGSYEEWRADNDAFPSDVLGNALDGWAGERWLDIRAESVMDVMMKRLDLAVEKGCDGVEPDNMDGYTNNSGFPLTASDQLLYNKSIADEAHRRGLSVGLKNDVDQILELEPFFDFAVNEQCHEFDECEAMSPFIEAGKPVFNAEYATRYVDDASEREKMCNKSKSLHIQTLVLPLDLDDSFRYSCP